MPILKVPNISLVAQPTNKVCWWASAQMVYKWSKATGRGKMLDPIAPETGFSERFKANGNWFCGDNGFLAGMMNMQKFKTLPMNYASLSTFLNLHGPVFTSVQKNWANHNHSHAVVIAGVADTGVWVCDPEPVGQGSSLWLTWAEINKAIQGVAAVADFAFLTAA